jgi:hypothetical protein
VSARHSGRCARKAKGIYCQRVQACASFAIFSLGQANAASMSRPPKTPPQIPFGSSDRSASVNAISTGNNDHGIVFRTGVSINGASEKSRESLRESISRRRTSLTPQENVFLEELCIKGNEIEVKLAHSKLLDDDLFFEHHDDSANVNEWSGSDAFSLSRERSSKEALPNVCLSDRVSPRGTITTGSIVDVIPMRNDDRPRSQSAGSSCSFNVGSARRQELLQGRRKSLLFGKIWKAHESGLAVTDTSSRRLLLSRRNSFTNSSRRNVLQKSQRLGDIFRATNARENTTSTSSSTSRPEQEARTNLFMNDNKSDNNRRGSLRQSRIPSRPQLRRLTSESSRKSVTFGELPSPRQSRAESDDFSITALRKAAPIRSDSSNSIPTLHQGHTILNSSPSDRSFKSIPSLHKAHHVHSDASVRSSAGFSDITTEWSRTEDRNPSITADDEKKLDQLADWTSPVPTKVEIKPTIDGSRMIQDNIKLLSHHTDTDSLSHHVLLRDASVSNYEGQGIEVADWESTRGSLESFSMDALNVARRFDSMVSFNDGNTSVISSNSFDETISFDRLNNVFRRNSQALIRSLSDEEVNGVFLGITRKLLHDTATTSSTQELAPIYDQDDSWKIDDDDDLDYYDSWMVIQDEYENGYGGGGTLPFHILGTSAEDIDAQPHVLSPPLMESLQPFLPISRARENFWMKYSLVRDGANMLTFLQYARGAQHSLLAIETVDGEVFGAFTAKAWRRNWNYFGSSDSFLWRMRHTRQEKTHSIIDQAQIESEVDVFPYTGKNQCIQLCTYDKIGIGGGAGNTLSPDTASISTLNHGEPIKEHEWGFGLTVQSDMLTGTTSPCVTFGSPSLSAEHSDGSIFEIINMELWTLTPCTRLEDAEKLELGKLFLQQHRH